jgi:NAD(P)-dependent dehydrogenase (short-subunit alcohol dehydrogenase family)
MRTDRKVAVITGASRGIGAALVKAYRNRNYRVVATARSLKPSSDDEVLTVPGDIAVAKPFTQYTEADCAAMLGVNLAGFFYITQLAIAEMEKQGSGHIVQITTSLVDHAIAGVPSVLASLTKGGLNGATKSLAIEYAKRGIRVNAVAPGIIKTPMNPPEMHDLFASLHPMGRMGTIEDIVDAILYLESTNFVTGEILHVDGGQSAGH